MRRGALLLAVALVFAASTAIAAEPARSGGAGKVTAATDVVVTEGYVGVVNTELQSLAQSPAAHVFTWGVVDGSVQVLWTKRSDADITDSLGRPMSPMFSGTLSVDDVKAARALISRSTPGLESLLWQVPGVDIFCTAYVSNPYKHYSIAKGAANQACVGDDYFAQRIIEILVKYEGWIPQIKDIDDTGVAGSQWAQTSVAEACDTNSNRQWQNNADFSAWSPTHYFDGPSYTPSRWLNCNG